MHILPVGAVHDEDEAVHLVVILRPDPAEALAAAQVIDGDVVTLQYSTVQYSTVRYSTMVTQQVEHKQGTRASAVIIEKPSF